MTMKIMIVAIIALALAAAAPQIGAGQESVRPKDPTPQAAPYDPLHKFPVEELKEDLDVLWNVLDEGHGGFERYTPKSALKKTFDGIRAGLTGPRTELDFYLRLLPFIAEIKDGHTRAQMSEAAEGFLENEPVAFPFGLRFLDGRAYIFRDLSGERGIKEGSELLAVNGMPVAKILPELLSLVPDDAGIQTRKLRQLESPAAFGRLFAIRFGRSRSFKIRIRPAPGGSIGELTVAGIRGRDVVRILNERYPETARRRPAYELSFQKDAAILTIRAFGDDPDKSVPPYPEFLKKAFLVLEEKQVPALVIDLRDNGGGQDDYGKLLFAYFADRPFEYYKALEAKKDHYDLFKYTTVSAKQIEDLPKHVTKNARGWFDVQGHPNLGLQQPRAPRFTGKVAILINGLSFSATGETTSLFHFHHKAVFFGEECGAGYYGNASGFVVMVTLPNTGVRVRVPLVLYTMAVGGYPADRGIVPDFLVAPTIDDLLAGRDPVMERALAFLASAGAVR